MGICKVCGKQHDDSYGKGIFCSRRCQCVYAGRILAAKPDFVPYFCREDAKRIYPARGNWECKICKKQFKTRKERQIHEKTVHILRPRHHIAWNKGLTSETSESVRRAVLTRKERMARGEYHIPKRHMSEKQKEILSRKQSERIAKSGSGGFRDVGWYKIKNINGIEYTVRGKWELAVAERLNTLGILWIRNNIVHYFLEYNRYYNPDFYLPNTNEYVEVKGYYSEKDKKKMKSVVESNPGISIMFIDEHRYADFINGTIPLTKEALPLYY